MLSDQDILGHCLEGWIRIDPFDKQCIQPASYDVHLGLKLVAYTQFPLNEADPRGGEGAPDTYSIWIPDHGYPLQPGQFLLGSLLEHIQIPANMSAQVHGKSSLGRLGLLVHATAGFVDPGWRGHLTLELHNLLNVPIRLYPGMRIAQISFTPLSSPSVRPYGSKELSSRYQDSPPNPIPHIPSRIDERLEAAVSA